jgi:hypothetical protein
MLETGNWKEETGKEQKDNRHRKQKEKEKEERKE